ncbi:MAG: hypothetical protein H0V15_04945 [Solirubrobacterales bacterium]|nr:hypothetical protein [Solirubrobacterales bacterium]
MTISIHHRDLIARLAAAEVNYILVGGLAVGAWGHLRATEDFDLVPDPDYENLSRLIGVLEELGGRVKQGEQMLDSGSVRIYIRTGDKAYVVTELGDVDVLQGLPQIPRYAELETAAEEADVEGLNVRVCSLQHLIEMKRAADRPMDRMDLEALKTAHPKAFEEG